MKFNVKLLNQAGDAHEEVMDAADKFALYDSIRASGLTLIFAEEVKQHSGFHLPAFLTGALSKQSATKMKMRDRIIFARNLGSMIEAGLAVSRALAVMERQSKNKKLKKLIGKLIENIAAGKTLSDSMKEFPGAFSQLFISMVKAGEESGSLAQSLRVVASQLESSYTLNKKIRGALMYPSIILIAMVGIGFFMLTYVVPTLSATFKELNADLPFSTKLVIGLSDFLKAHIIISIALILGFVIAVYSLARTKKGKRFLEWAFLRLPVIGLLIKQVNSARTARTFSSLLSSGVDMIVATQITRDVLQNSYYKTVLEVIEKQIQKGEPISTTFAANEHLYPTFVAEMVSVGEETGQLAAMFMSIATYYEAEVDQRTKDMSTIIEPILMIVIGAAVGFFAISMIMPIYSLGNKI